MKDFKVPFKNERINPHFVVLTGSRLYGYSTPTSDYDYRGFIIPPDEDKYGLINFNHYCGTGDTTIYSLKEFINQLIKGNTQIWECLFAPEQNIIVNSDAFKYLYENYTDLLSKKIIRSILGFALAEWRKARGVMQEIKYDSEDDEILLKKLYGRFQLDRTQISDILDIVYRNKDPRSEVINLGVNKEHKDEINKFGYRPKSACNTIRLLSEGLQLAEDGKLHFPLENIDMCKNIRNGVWSWDEGREIYKY